MSNNLSIGRIKEFHFGIESAFGSGLTQSGSTLVEALEGSNVEFAKRDKNENKAVNGSRDANDPITGRYQEIPFNIECHALMQADANSASAIENMLMATLGATSIRVTPSNQSVLAGSGKTIIKMSDASGYQLFDGLVIDNNIAFVTKVDTVLNQVTVAPPLLSTPTVGSSIGKTRTIHLTDDQPTVAVDAKFDWMTLRGTGGTIKNLSFESNGKDPVKMKITGALATQVVTGRATLTADVATTSTTTFSVDNTSAFEAGSVFDLGSESGVVVVSVDNTNLQITVTRGATPSTHLTGAVLNPAWTSGSVNGSPAHGRSGRALRAKSSLTGESVSVPAVSRTFTIDTGATLINDEDGSERPTYSVGGSRKINGKRTLHLRELDLQWLRSAHSATDYQPELYEMSAGGRRLSIFMPRVSLKTPSISDGTTRDISQDFDAGFAKDADGNEISNRVVVIALS